MEIHKSSPGYLAFDRFEVDLTSGRLLKNGRRIRLQPQPFRMLEMMLQRPGELITREEAVARYGIPTPSSSSTIASAPRSTRSAKRWMIPRKTRDSWKRSRGAVTGSSVS
jgi:DNA-binding response OmpR family regulator